MVFRRPNWATVSKKKFQVRPKSLKNRVKLKNFYFYFLFYFGKWFLPTSYIKFSKHKCSLLDTQKVKQKADWTPLTLSLSIELSISLAENPFSAQFLPEAPGWLLSAGFVEKFGQISDHVVLEKQAQWWPQRIAILYRRQ